MKVHLMSQECPLQCQEIIPPENVVFPEKQLQHELQRLPSLQEASLLRHCVGSGCLGVLVPRLTVCKQTPAQQEIGSSRFPSYWTHFLTLSPETTGASWAQRCRTGPQHQGSLPHSFVVPGDRPQAEAVLSDQGRKEGAVLPACRRLPWSCPHIQGTPELSQNAGPRP